MRYWGILLILVLVAGCVEEQPISERKASEYGSISGKIIPAESAKVRAIQNWTVIGETRTNPSNGRYTIQNLPEGQYGLLFTLDNTNDTRHIPVYIYNDEINMQWHADDGYNINENISVIADQDSPNHDINLDIEYADYFADKISVLFKKYDVSEDEINKTIQHFNCSIIDYYSYAHMDYISYELNIPDDKTVIEILRNFQSHPYVVGSGPDSILFAV